MRFLYAAIVAIGAFAWTYVFFSPNGLVWALFLATPLVPLLDWMMPAAKFQWRPQSPYPPAPNVARSMSNQTASMSL
jgi:hypothetical protein